MAAAVQVKFFERKDLPFRSLLDIAVMYVGYIVLGNLSIKLNPVGFYQIIKALIPPAVLLVQSVQAQAVPSGRIMGSVALLTAGVIAATVTDDQVVGNIPGMTVGIVCVFATAFYNILAGSKQTQLGASAHFWSTWPHGPWHRPAAMRMPMPAALPCLCASTCLWQDLC